MSSALFKRQMRLIEILRWPLIVVETSKKAHSIGN